MLVGRGAAIRIEGEPAALRGRQLAIQGVVEAGFGIAFIHIRNIRPFVEKGAILMAA